MSFNISDIISAIPSLLFIGFGAFLNAQMDRLYANFEGSLFKNLNPNFWNPYLSHGYKWKNGDKAQGERYFGSSTIFVWLTDGWHLLKGGMVGCFFIAICFYSIAVAFAFSTIWFLFFEFGYRIYNK